MNSSTTIEGPEHAAAAARHELPAAHAALRSTYRGETQIGIARAIIIAVTAGLAWYTWGHWGDFQIDCGREIYVPTAISQGKLLYRDIWYPYGPLAPYSKAALFRIFGIHMNVLYGFGIALAVGAALVAFEIGRRLNLGVTASLVAPLLLLSQAFHPFIFNLIFPYSYGASVACFLGLACLCFVLLHATTRRTWHLGFAALLASLVALSKQEFGVACLLLLALDIAGAYVTRRSPRELFRDISVALAGLTPAFAIYGWFVWKISARGLFTDNWIPVPGTYFMRTYGKKMLADQGFRFDPYEWLDFAKFVVLSAALWWALARVNAAVVERFRLRSRRSIALLLAGNIVPVAMVLHTSWAAKVLLVPLTRIFGPSSVFVQGLADIRGFLGSVLLPRGLFLIGIVFLASGIFKLWKRRDCGLVESALAIYALMAGLRQMMGVSLQTAVFFNTSLVLIFIIVLKKILNWGSRNLDATRRGWLVNGLLAAEGIWLFLMFFPNPSPLPAPLTTSIGTIYTQPDIATIAPQIISFMKTHTKNHKDILVIPEPPSLYVFAGMQSPTHWHQLHPGIVPPDHEQEYINELKSSDVRYILIAHRHWPEYGVAGFIEDGYNHEIYRWIMANYTQVGQFGPLTQTVVPRTFMMWIYERKGAQEKSSGNPEVPLAQPVSQRREDVTSLPVIADASRTPLAVIDNTSVR